MRDALELAALHLELGPLGWRVWLTRTAPCWRAVAAPADMPIPDAIAHGNTQTAADTPAGLRAACAARYGWNATCVTCNRPARDCGHRIRAGEPAPERTAS